MAATGDHERYRPARLERGRGCAGATDIGPVRDGNEDAYWIDDGASVLAVADGLGGLPAGEVASAVAVGAARAFLDGAPGEAGASPGADVRESLVRRAAEAAHRAVLEVSAADLRCRGMATTLLLAVVSPRVATILHVGDSRALLFRGAEVVATTFDHNAVGDLRRAGVLSAEQARRHPARNLVREVVGLPEGYQAECQDWALEAGDVLVLCTDGVSDALSEDEMARILAAGPDAAAAARRLVEAAALEGGLDNATAVVRHVT